MQKNGNNSFYYIWSLSIIVCLILVLFTLVFVSCRSSGAEKDPDATGTAAASPSPTTSDGGDENPDETTNPENPDPSLPVTGGSSVILQETADMGAEYLDKFVFLGDSTTYGLRHYGDIVRKEQVWTPTDGTFSLFNQSIVQIYHDATDQTLTIEEILELEQPEYMLVTLGVNGVSMMNEDYFKKEYNALLTRIKTTSPNTKVIINSIYPVADSYPHQGSINNSLIDAANLWLQDIAEENGLRYLNTASILKNESGAFPEDYHNGDGLHPTSATYKLIMEYVRTHGYQ